MPSILVFGHKNPDNDAISAAIGYAYLKNELAKKNGDDVAVSRPRPSGFFPRMASRPRASSRVWAKAIR